MKRARSTPLARAAALAAAGASFALYAQTVNLRPGLYEFVSVTDMQLPPEVAARMPPEYAAMMRKPQTHQHCITAADLDHFSHQLAEGRPDAQKCAMTERSVSGGEVKFALQCERTAVRYQGSFATDSFKGVMVMSGGQGRPPVTIRITGQRIGSCSS
jgi:hypothetical protein